MITHDGERKNGFAECKDDTMKTRGKGADVQGDERSWHKGKGRKLRERIEL